MVTFYETMSTMQLIGAVLATIGLVGTLFSPYRYLIAYLVAGMAYWLSIEGVSYLLQSSNFSTTNAYLIAVAISMVAIFVWIAITEPKRQKERAAYRQANYIEHTPLYDREVPTSKG